MSHSQGLEVFQQRLFFCGAKVRAKLMTASAIAGVEVRAVGRFEFLVELSLVDRKPNIRGIVGLADLEFLHALRRWLEQFRTGWNRTECR